MLDQRDVTEICSDILAAQTKSEQLAPQSTPIPISSSETVPSLHSVVKSSPHSMSMIMYGMHRSMSAPEIHHHQKPEELFLAQQLQQKV